MGPGRLAALYLLALAVPLCEGLLELDLARGSAASLALLPWMIVGPAPRMPGARPVGALVLGLLALPPLALAAALDGARGVPWEGLTLAAGTTWLGLVLWTHAAERAATRRSLQGLYPVLWFLLVPLGVALRVALAWVPARAPLEYGRPPWLAVDPLLFCQGWGRPGGLAELRLGECAFALLGAGFALACISLPADPDPWREAS